MRRHILAAGLAAATLIPSIAFAQQSCERQRDGRVVGTVAGAGIGALLGSAIAGRGDRTVGAVIGAGVGGVAGNQLTKPDADCSRAYYGYYDTNGMWHANNSVDRGVASGYFDRNNTWVAGAPNGYYDAQGRWIAAGTTAAAAGYYDGRGRWVPAASSAYYDTDGQLVSGTASGYYDNGRWIAGPAVGRYDQNGRWMAGQASGRRDANGVWIADAQPGYYEDGRWRAGEVRGYYDAQGRWMSMNAGDDRRNDDRGYGDARRTRADWVGAPSDIRGRVAWLDRRIQRARGNGTLSRAEADRALDALSDLRRDELSRRRITPRDAVRIQAKLDDLNSDIRWDRRGGYGRN